MDVQASYTIVCSDHDHEIRFYTYPNDINIGDMSSSEMLEQAAYSDTMFLPKADYIGLKGDIKIIYDITSPSELTRLKFELDTNNVQYKETLDQLTVYLDFDNIESNVPTECLSPWISSILTRTIMSGTKDAIFVRIVVDGDYVKTKYKLTEPLALSTPTKKYVFVFDGSCTINGQRLELANNKHAVIHFEGSVSIVPDSSSLVVVFEELN